MRNRAMLVSRGYLPGDVYHIRGAAACADDEDDWKNGIPPGTAYTAVAVDTCVAVASLGYYPYEEYSIAWAIVKPGLSINHWGQLLRLTRNILKETNGKPLRATASNIIEARSLEHFGFIAAYTEPALPVVYWRLRGVGKDGR